MTECTTLGRIDASNLYCEMCSRGYAIHELRHQCGAIKCDKYDTVDWREEYFRDIKPDRHTHLVVCEDCETRERELHEPRECFCPQCGFTGSYVPRPDDLCPACTAAPAAVAVKPPPQRRVRAVAAGHVAKPPLCVTKPPLRVTAKFGLGRVFSLEGYSYDRATGPVLVVSEMVVAHTDHTSDDFSASVLACVKKIMDQYTIMWRLDFDTTRALLICSFGTDIGLEL